MKHEVKFSASKEVVKMIEALQRSPAVRPIAWGLVVVIPLTAAVWKAADIVRAIAVATTH
ncbi:MAG: hypothetical protein VB131_08950 [Burkholderia gladioli]